MNAIASDDLPDGGLKAVLDGLRGLGPARLAAMGVVALGMIGLLALLALRGTGAGSGPMAVLYGDLDLREAGEMTDALEKAHIPHALGGNSDQILVPAEDVAAARLLLARSNLPSGGTVGYELFDHADGLTSTQFEQDINQTRALEGELARSIRMIDGVRSARVHLVLPRREPFAADQQPAQASVLLTMRGAERLDAEGVQAILNLVSAAVPGLKPQAIAIIDSRGNVLARTGSARADLSDITSLDDARKAIELRLAHQIEDMLDASLGPDKVRAEASVTLDTSRMNETEETFNPDQQVVRSQQTVTDKSRNTEAQQNTTVQNNLPNADAGRPQSGSQSERSEETNNYEIGKTVRTRTEIQPRIARLSLAVLVDGETILGRDGRPTWQPRDAKDLADITALVKSAAGFDAARGDTVTVRTMRFTSLAGDADEPTTPPSRFGLDRLDLVKLGQTGILGIVALATALFVFRPMVTRLVPLASADERRTSATSIVPAPDADPAIAAPKSGALAIDRPAAAEVGLLGRAGTPAGEASASIRRVTSLVEQFPDETLAIVRGWLAEGPR